MESGNSAASVSSFLPLDFARVFIPIDAIVGQKWWIVN
jgi:hypothetical protein